MGRTECEAALSGMTLTAFSDKSKNVSVFLLAPLDTMSSHNHFHISTVREMCWLNMLLGCEEPQLSNFKDISFCTSCTCRQEVVKYMENLCTSIHNI